MRGPAPAPPARAGHPRRRRLPTARRWQPGPRPPRPGRCSGARLPGAPPESTESPAAPSRPVPLAMPPALDAHRAVALAALRPVALPPDEHRAGPPDARPERRVDLFQHGPSKLDPRDRVELVGGADEQAHPRPDL